MRGFQNSMNAIWQDYVYLMSQPLKQTVIYLADRQPEVVNTQNFTPQAIEQVNRAAALIDGVEDEGEESSGS